LFHDAWVGWAYHAGIGTLLLLALALIPAQPLTVTHSARAIRPGEVVVLTIRGAAAAITVRAFDREWRAFQADDHSWRVLMGIDMAIAPGRYDVVITGGAAQVVHPLVVTARQFPTRRLRVDPKLVIPPASERERIDRESRELEAAWQSSPAERLWRGPFVRPVPDAANSAFGAHSVYNGETTSRHGGADFLSPPGRPVKAPGGGRIVIAGSRYFSGNTVVIDHGQGLFSLLAHLTEIDVKLGDTVSAGDVVGTVGSTGRVTGPHLHWAVRLNGARVDPLSLLAALGR
jgi:hypothetical protein